MCIRDRGSTGVPTGVEVTHRQLSASTNARAQFYSQEASAFAVLSSISFDSSIVGLFWTLACGGTIVLPTEDEAHDIDALAHLFSRRRLSHALCVPTLYQALLRRRNADGTWPAHVIVAGESCPKDLVDQHHRIVATSALTNEYGPTEATVWATAHRCAPTDGPVPIGRPIAGTWAAVVSANTVVPRGVAGELVLGGAGITAGYFNDADLTGERFGSTDELISAAALPEGPTFRSGDTVRLDACLLYTSPSPRDATLSRMPSSA